MHFRCLFISRFFKFLKGGQIDDGVMIHFSLEKENGILEDQTYPANGIITNK